MRKQFATLALLSITAGGFAEVHEIQQSGFSFIPDTVTVNPGDTVRWIRGSGSHTVNHGDCTLADDALFMLPLNAANPIAEWVVPNAVNGTIPFFCDVQTHCSQFGMAGEIVVEPKKGSTVHEVVQVGFTFVPETIAVSPGDTVRWTWSDGGHTVSSGDRDTCIEDDLQFNMLLDDVNTIALWEVPEDMPDVVDYLCIFHCPAGHVGTINRSVEGDLNGDACVDGADLAIALGCWNTPCADLNGDGNTDGVDLATLLGAWGCG